MSAKKKTGGRVAQTSLFEFDVEAILQPEAEYSPEERSAAITAYMVLLQDILTRSEETFQLPHGRLTDAARFVAAKTLLNERTCERALRHLAERGYIEKKTDALRFPMAPMHGKTLAKSSVRVYRLRAKRRKETADKLQAEKKKMLSKPAEGSKAPARPLAQSTKPAPATAQNQPEAERRTTPQADSPALRRLRENVRQPGESSAAPAQADQKQATGTSKPASQPAEAPQKRFQTAPGKPAEAPRQATAAAQKQPKQTPAEPPAATRRASDGPQKPAQRPAEPSPARTQLPRFTQMERPQRGMQAPSRRPR